MTDRTPEQTEVLVLSSLTSNDRVAHALRLGLTVDAFQVEIHRQAWERTLAAFQGGRTVLTEADLREQGVAVVVGVEDYEAYVRELVDFSTAGRAYSVLQKGVPSIGSRPREAVREIISGLSDIVSSTSLHVGRTDEDAHERLEHMLRLREIIGQDEVFGIPTGLAVFDDAAFTWKPGELATVFGYSGFGKSWLLVYFCCIAYLAGKKILFLTPEESKLDVELRTDVVLSRLVEEKHGEEWGFTHKSFINGSVDIEKYKQWTERFALRGDWVTIDAGTEGSFSVDDAVALTREHRPDVLAINGFHMLTTSKGRSWEQMFESGQRIKGLTQDLGITTLAVTQARREAGIIPDDPPDPYDVAYGHAIVESSDRLISLGKVRGSPLRRVFKVPKFRNGPEITNRMYLEFDVDHGVIRQVKVKT